MSGGQRNVSVIATTVDPTGTTIILSARVWLDKVLRSHPEMAGSLEAILRATATPDHIEPDPVRRDRVRYFSRGKGPSRWLLVVVSYEQAPARIVTAFGNRKDPRSWIE